MKIFHKVQGERRFFRVAYKWLINNDYDTAKLNLALIPEFGRWDDLINICYGTKAADVMANIVFKQYCIDMVSNTPSLLGKWMPSENASNQHTKEMARWFTRKFKTDPRTYRKSLSSLRKKINILEMLMSTNQWDKIEFDKIPSKAGMKYRNAFAVKEVTAARYKAFMENKETKVNASVLNPVDIAEKALYKHLSHEETLGLCKYWDNLKDYYEGREENAIAVVDVSGSMSGQPMAAAVGMGAYIAEKSHGPFAGHFITFSRRPQLVEFQGDNIVDKLQRCRYADWGMNTNIEATMDLILNTAIEKKLSQTDLPARLYIFSDMEFDAAAFGTWRSSQREEIQRKTLFEIIERKFNEAGYEMPKVTFWNLDARTPNIPAIGDKFNYISGFSMSQMEAVMAGLSAEEMMLRVLNKYRYKDIQVAE